MILQRQFSKVSRRKRVVVRDTENPKNGASLETRSSHDSGPGWSESSSSSSYSSSYEKSFSRKKKSEDKTIRLGPNRVKMKDMTEQQLENLIKTDENPSKNIEKNNKKLKRGLVIAGTSVGLASSFNSNHSLLRRVAGIPIGIGTGLVVAEGEKKLQKNIIRKRADMAREELERRNSHEKRFSKEDPTTFIDDSFKRKKLKDLSDEELEKYANPDMKKELKNVGLTGSGVLIGGTGMNYALNRLDKHSRSAALRGAIGTSGLAAAIAIPTGLGIRVHSVKKRSKKAKEELEKRKQTKD